ncbi:nuclear autoantigenic sperm protein isoform X1 [Xiphophorus maculatus]|uniref:Nuclear autoantigenic sperm protein (histone-binding) n=1 Tax=Xiphophorus maculatus TaxID=8083 RepID=M4A9E3_XIPMA|nr:nuclear autoantigenic sperm protein isoform X1 [Xiphophorus maculatus]
MPVETSTASGSGSAEEKPCSSTAAAETSGDVMEEAKKLIGTGKRHLVMGDVVSAVNVFQEACSMLAAKYGDTADECGEAFFLCGKSLLELARMENGVLGNALEGVPEESEEEEQPKNPNLETADNLDEKTREELRKQVCDAMAEKVEPKEEVKNENAESEEPVDPEAGETSGAADVGEEKSSVQATEEVRDASAEAVNEEEEEDEGIEESNAEAEQTDETSEDDDDEDEDKENTQDNEEEDVGNLQLAWEMLEVAKVIFKRKESKDDQLMAAQAYLKLGEVSAETGNYPQALEDFQECLIIQLKLLPPHCRLLAETHYHVATTLVFMDQYDQAIKHYNSSVKVIETRLAMLQEVIDAAAGDDGAAEEKSELEELRQLLPEIREKVEDTKESQRTASAASQAIQQTLGAPSTSSTFPCENGGPSSSTAFASTSQIPVKTSESALSSKAVSDISHLVRKKRKPEEESPVKDTDAKQLKQEATVNGSGDSSASNSSETQEGKSKESAAVESSS